MPVESSNASLAACRATSGWTPPDSETETPTLTIAWGWDWMCIQEGALKPVLSSYGCYSCRYRVRGLVSLGRGAEGPRHWRCLSLWRRPRCRAGGNQYLGTATSWEFQRGATLPESNPNGESVRTRIEQCRRSWDQTDYYLPVYCTVSKYRA